MIEVVVEVVTVELVVSTEGSGILGLGQVISLASSGQNSLIFWKRYQLASGRESRRGETLWQIGGSWCPLILE